MAVTVVQQPTSPNAADSSLLYSVSSTNTAQPQFIYICDIYESGSSELLSRMTQVPNSNTSATFKVSDVVRSTLQYKDYKKQSLGVGTVSLVSGTTYSTENEVDVTSSRVFTFKFGEAYGTSISSSLTYYPDLTSEDLTVFPGVWSANDPTDFQITVPYSDNSPNPYTLNYNFPSSSFLISPTSKTYGDLALTDDPYKLTVSKRQYVEPFIIKTVGQTHYETFTYLTQDSPSNSPSSGRIDVFFGAVNLGRITLNNLTTGFNKNYTINFGVGPANITDFANSGKAGSSLTPVQAIAAGQWTHYAVRLGNDTSRFINESYAYTNDIKRDWSLGFESNYEIVRGQEKLRFAFINRYGVYDYFTVYGPLRRDTEITRDTVSLPRVDYSYFLSTYSVSSRGEKQYHFSETDNYSITTQLLDKPMANWVEQLFDSPEVYVQQGDEFIPVLITNNNYQHNNSTSRNKTFTYTINFQPAKGREIYSEETQDCLVLPNLINVRLNASSSNLALNEVTMDLTASNGSIIYWGFSPFTVDFNGSDTGSLTTTQISYYRPSNVTFNNTFNYAGIATTASADYIVYVDGQEYSTYFTASTLPAPGDYTFSFSENFTQDSIENLAVSASFFNFGQIVSSSFRTSQQNLVCVDSQYLSLTSSQDVVRRIEYGYLPWIDYETGSFYYRIDEGIEVGTRLRDASYNFITASGYLVGEDLRIKQANTLNRLKDKIWSIETGSLYTITNGTITAITDLSTIVDNLPPLVSIPDGVTTDYNKVTADYDGYAAYDISNKSRYNFNAPSSFTATGFRQTLPAPIAPSFDVSVAFPVADSFYPYTRLHWRKYQQNAPHATTNRTTNAYSSITRCGFPHKYRFSWNSLENNNPMTHWVWRGYMYSGQAGAQEEPSTYGTYIEMCNYTGSWSNTLFVSGTLEPGKRIWNSPTTTTTGTGPVAGFLTRGTGSNDYFPILTQDGTKAVLYDDVSDTILEIKNANGTNYTGSAVKRWEGPYFWRGAYYDDQAQARDEISQSDCDNPVYVYPYKSIEDIDVGDKLYTGLNSSTFVPFGTSAGNNRYTKLFDYNPNVTSPISLPADLTYVYKVDGSGIITDKTLASDIVTYYDQYVRCVDGLTRRSTVPTYTTTVPDNTQFYNPSDCLYWIKSGSVDSSTTTITTLVSTGQTGCYSYPTGSSTSQSLFMQDQFRFDNTGFTATVLAPFDYNVGSVNVTNDSILVAGTFTTISGSSHRKFAKMDFSGNIDPNFDKFFDDANYRGRGFLYDADRDYYITYGQSGGVSPTSSSLLIMDATGSILFDGNSIGSTIIGSAEVMYNYLYITVGSPDFVSRRINLDTLTLDPNWNVESSPPPLNYNFGRRLKRITSKDLPATVSGSVWDCNRLTPGRLYKRDVNSIPGAATETYREFSKSGGPVIYGAAQSGSTVIVFGDYTSVTSGSYVGVPMYSISKWTAKTNAELDVTWNYPSASIGTVLDVKFQSDGKILIAGDLTPSNFIGSSGCAKGDIVRLNQDGTLDTTFMSPTVTGGVVSDLEVLDDDSIIAVGDFDTFWYNPLQSGSLAGLGFVVLDNNGNISEYQ